MFESSCFHGEAHTVALTVASLKRTLHGTKKCRNFDYFRRSDTKMPSQALETYLSFFSQAPLLKNCYNTSFFFYTCVESLTKNKEKRAILRPNQRLEAPVPPFFLRGNSAITPTSPLVRNSAIIPPPCDGLFGALTTVWQSDSSFRVL